MTPEPVKATRIDYGVDLRLTYSIPVDPGAPYERNFSEALDDLREALEESTDLRDFLDFLHAIGAENVKEIVGDLQAFVHKD